VGGGGGAAHVVVGTDLLDVLERLDPTDMRLEFALLDLDNVPMEDLHRARRVLWPTAGRRLGGVFSPRGVQVGIGIGRRLSDECLAFVCDKRQPLVQHVLARHPHAVQLLDERVGRQGERRDLHARRCVCRVSGGQGDMNANRRLGIAGWELQEDAARLENEDIVLKYGRHGHELVPDSVGRVGRFIHASREFGFEIHETIDLSQQSPVGHQSSLEQDVSSMIRVL